MKKLFLMSVMALFCLMTANAQKTEVPQTNQKVETIVEQMPEYPGGKPALISYIQNNIKYPQDAAKQGVHGRVVLKFVVETDGSISDIEVIKSVFPSLDAEGLRLVKSMPKWTPGKQDGKPVRVRYILPISFNL